MYKRCIFCTASLGENEEMERFTVGAQLAFDPGKGRLWAICNRCGRWNLAPIEERWEAVEDAERSFRGTSLRVHHENMGIARLPAGMLLVRLGAAPPFEVAAWRYGTELQRRRRRYRIAQTLTAISVVVLGVWIPTTFTQGRRVVLAADTRPLRLAQLAGAEFTRGPGGIRLDVQPRERWFGSVPGIHVLEGQAEPVLGRVLPAVNHQGADSVLLEGALGQLARAGSAEDFLQRLGGTAAVSPREWSLTLRRWKDRWCLCKLAEEDPYAYPSLLEEPHALALEMALQEELEREVLAGRLAQLRLAWREAEEIAAIADAL